MEKIKVYLDNCSLNRPFDEQNQMKVRLETIAKLYIQSQIRSGIYDLAWSYMLDLENADNPYEEKRNAIKIWKDIASVHCKSSPKILETGRIYEKLGITPKDALHIACAVHSGCDYFISTDIKLIRKHIDGIILINPINFIGEAEA